MGVIKDIYAGGLITAGATQAATSGTVVQGFFFNNTLLSSFTSLGISTTATQSLDSFSTSTYRSARYFVQIVQGNNIQVSELSVFHDDTTSYISEYGISYNNGQLGSFDTQLVSPNVTLLWNANSSTAHIIKVSRMAITR